MGRHISGIAIILQRYHPRLPSEGGSNTVGARRHVSRGGGMRVLYPLLMASGESSAPNRQGGRFFLSSHFRVAGNGWIVVALDSKVKARPLTVQGTVNG